MMSGRFFFFFSKHLLTADGKKDVFFFHVDFLVSHFLFTSSFQ